MEADHYISEQLTKAVSHLVSGIGGVKERLGAVYTNRIFVIAGPRHRFPSSLQGRFDAIMERLRNFDHLSDSDCSEIAADLFQLWLEYERLSAIQGS